MILFPLQMYLVSYSLFLNALSYYNISAITNLYRTPEWIQSIRFYFLPESAKCLGLHF